MCSSLSSALDNVLFTSVNIIARNILCVIIVAPVICPHLFEPNNPFCVLSAIALKVQATVMSEPYAVLYAD